VEQSAKGIPYQWESYFMSLLQKLLITAWPCCGWQMQSGVAFKETKDPPPQYGSQTLGRVHMLPNKHKSHEIPSKLSLWFMLCLKAVV